MRIEVDYTRCDSNGVCADMAPEVFEIDDGDRLQVYGRDGRPDAHRRDVELAAASCPKLAITLIED